jgi:hypothetical protein
MYGGVEWLGSDAGATQLMCTREFSYDGYYGNEASTAEFYTKASFVADIPSYDQRALSAPPAAITSEQINPNAIPVPKGKGKAAAQPKLTSLLPTKRTEGGDENEEPQNKRQKVDSPGASSSAGLIPGQSAADAAKGLWPGGAMTAAEKKRALAGTFRTIHVLGIKGPKAQGAHGETITLKPGQGLRELKSIIRDVFGKVPHHVLGPLHIVDDEGVPCMKKNGDHVVVKAEDLQSELWVKCTYTYKEGNMNLPQPRRGGPFGGDLTSSLAQEMMLTMMMMMSRR